MNQNEKRGKRTWVEYLYAKKKTMVKTVEIMITVYLQSRN